MEQARGKAMRLVSTAFVVLMVAFSAAHAETPYGGAGVHGFAKQGIFGFPSKQHSGAYRHPGVYPFAGIAAFPYPYRYSEPHFGYWPNRLGYRYGRSYYGDGGYFRTEPYVYAPPTIVSPPQNVVRVEDAPSPTRAPAGGSSGWTLLADGDYPAAIRVFGDDSTTQPHAGLPKIGYALSVALGGDLGSGVWAMRRAAAIDPQALSYLYPDPRINARVVEVLGLYQQRLRRDGDPDAAFMVATLSYLAGDPYAARAAVDHARRAGDNAESTQNLLGLLDAVDQASASGE